MLEKKKYNRLTPIEIAYKRGRVNYWLCKCDCGKSVIVREPNIKNGHTKSCGCIRVERMKLENPKYNHGLRYHRLNSIWRGMKTRCFNPNTPFYKHYGGRGITVCEEWTDSENGFQNFAKWAIANGWDENKSRIEQSIDRIDVNGNYEPSNCRFADMKTQRKNQRPKNK